MSIFKRGLKKLDIEDIVKVIVEYQNQTQKQETTGTPQPITNDTVTKPVTETVTESAPMSVLQDDIDLSTVRFLGTNVSAWPITTSLVVSLTNTNITYGFAKTTEWEAIDDVNANPWVICKHNGEWIAATTEWLRPGGITKSKASISGTHIKRAPLQNWEPTKGETLYFFVSTLARDARRNGNERSNIVKAVW